MKRFKRYFCFILVTCIVFANFVLCRNTYTLVSANEGTQLDPKVTIVSHELVGNFIKDNEGSPSVWPKNAYDGNVNTPWGPDCGKYDGTGIIFDLNGTYDISTIRITTPYALGKVTFYKVAVSNDKTEWTDIITVDDASDYGDGEGECTFSNLGVKGAKYVRVMLTGRQDGGTWPGLKEVEIFGVECAEEKPLDPKVTIVSHELVGNFIKDNEGSPSVWPNNAYDGNVNTPWGPDCGKYDGTGIIFELNGTYDISTIRITTPYALGKVTFYKVAVSNDKTEWTDIITVNDASDYGDGEGECTFRNLDVKEAKYVRVMLTGRQDGGTWPGLKEVEIFGTASTIKVPETGDTNVFAYVLVLVLACGIFINLARRTKLCGSR